MNNEIHLIQSIHLEVTNDDENYSTLRKISKEEIEDYRRLTSTLEILCDLIESGRNICKDAGYSSFRLKVFLEREDFYISDTPSRPLRVRPEKFLVPEEELQRYESLTPREKQILCFIYRGYKQDAIAFAFGMSVNTMKKHRANIYEKAHFRDRADLAVWCEKYLHSVFKETA